MFPSRSRILPKVVKKISLFILCLENLYVLAHHFLSFQKRFYLVTPVGT